jgi:hypothetical protein
MGAIRSPKDFWIGVVYLVVGGIGIAIGRDYSFGTAGRMGPGYFPVVVSWLLVLFAAISIARSLRLEGEPLGVIAWKPMALIVGSILAFGFLITTAGLVIAMVVMVLMSAAASEKFALDWKASAGLAALVAFCSLVFVRGLGVPMPLLGSWFGN